MCVQYILMCAQKYNKFTEQFNKIALSATNDRGLQSVDLIKVYAYGATKDLLGKPDKIKCNAIIKKYKIEIEEIFLNQLTYL